jgi:hypothetical protein
MSEREGIIDIGGLKHKLYAVQRATDVSKLEIMKMVHL